MVVVGAEAGEGEGEEVKCCDLGEAVVAVVDALEMKVEVVEGERGWRDEEGEGGKGGVGGVKKSMCTVCIAVAFFVARSALRRRFWSACSSQCVLMFAFGRFGVGVWMWMAWPPIGRRAVRTCCAAAWTSQAWWEGEEVWEVGVWGEVAVRKGVVWELV